MSEKNERRLATITCTEPSLRGSFTFYLNQRVTERSRRRIEKHLPQCPSCSKAIGLLRIVKQIHKEEATGMCG